MPPLYVSKSSPEIVGPSDFGLSDDTANRAMAQRLKRKQKTLEDHPEYEAFPDRQPRQWLHRSVSEKAPRLGNTSYHNRLLFFTIDGTPASGFIAFKTRT